MIAQIDRMLPDLSVIMHTVAGITYLEMNGPNNTRSLGLSRWN